ncbi:O-antigen polysaccharide polymerase Wzy [Bibersteinia trehalosi]|uniref:O-antigen polysaccharide polymerase Wzy n=1 Tax=Bibersteinia trehalosi TaxID=47735 RepID=UPI002D79A67C|nr:O-antigen polysaccharide polymerase Wzy [Bibersteinia trehalosi]
MAQIVVFLIYCLSLVWLGYSIWRSYRQRHFSFYLLFSVLYAITFFAGFPLSLIMANMFEYTLPDYASQQRVFGWAILAYLVYQMGYHIFSSKNTLTSKADVASFHAKTTACLLALVGVGSLFIFIYLNEGLLLFKLEKYSQIFSPLIQAVPLKRFFYFFLPALLLFFLLKPSVKRWWWFLILSVIFGILSYLAVGGTRANLAMAGLFFLILGLEKQYLSVRWLGLLVALGIVGMFLLALARYGLDIHGKEIYFTFLYLTRDTFSPWENLARIFSSEMEYQGLMPIIRDFYVYIPKSLWQERPDIVWNSANYFTKTVLGNQSGLAISPSLLGSFYIMGGYLLIPIGMFLVGGIIATFDRLFQYGSRYSVVLQTFCLGQVFNLIVLVREGFDAFFSRFFFFSLVFALCWLIAKGVIRWKR